MKKFFLVLGLLLGLMPSASNAETGKPSISDIAVEQVVYTPDRSVLGRWDVANPMLTGHLTFKVSDPGCSKLDGRIIVVDIHGWYVGPAWFDGEIDNVSGEQSFTWDGRAYSSYAGTYHYLIWFWRDSSCPNGGQDSEVTAYSPRFIYAGSAY